MRFWLDLGVDGLRLDAIPYLCVRDGTNNENLPETHAVLRRMRAVVDANYDNRMFLAEANQWPEDVSEYFGDGDECHVAYHFPLMPRMYMAVAQEDRHPVVEILEQTPEIPPNCQWAIFLRNHDELTLEMVSNRERDYMYQTYAADPRMRVNVGIRRRLATLLDNDEDLIRLMNSLLLSMPGSPILYYGDELGMGDNIYLGDRNGVRTPMQWSPDRNAGFSKADPQRLYLPPIMDPIYGYQAVNVEAQQRDAASLLNWMRRIIEVRKAHPVFGRGNLRMLHPGNRKVLAYVREHEDEAVLCVANLARGAQPVELDLAAFRGRVPIEMLGRTAFPPIDDLPYLLTLPGHGFYWFLLSAEAEAPAWHEERLPALRLATLVLPEGWRSLLPAQAQRPQPAQRALDRLLGEVLPNYLPTRRWFAAKGSAIASVALLQAQPWGEWLLTMLRVGLDDGTSQDYFLPLSIAWEEREVDSPSNAAAAALCRVRQSALPGLVYDAFADARFIRALVAAVEAGEQVTLDAAQLVFRPGAALADLVGMAEPLEVRPTPEASNSGAALGDRLFVKGYRRLRPGTSPEAEMGRFLTEVSPFAQIVPLAGTVEFRDAEGVATTLALVQGYVSNQGDLWQHTLDLLARLWESHAERADEWQGDPAAVAYAALVDTLGRRTAELHAALARTSGDPAFEPEAVQPHDIQAWRARLQVEAEQTLAQLARARERAATLDTEAAALADRVLERRVALATRVDEVFPARLDGLKTRVHGDLHLGQVLVGEGDVVFIDFEGEPRRSLAERRAKQSALVDVAGIVRSLDYAAHVALRDACAEDVDSRGRAAPAFDAWRSASIERFLAAYQATAAQGPGYPGDADARTLVDGFCLEKALYEVRYELDSRPEWVAVPLSGLLDLLDGGA
jgi:maltose alpha-D-glucosyltransferase/alpha-amylase